MKSKLKKYNLVRQVPVYLKIIFIIIVLYYLILKRKKNLRNKLFNNSRIKNENRILEKNLPVELYQFEKKPKISILIPQFDNMMIKTKYSYIDILKSILNQSIKDIEILLSFQKNSANLQTQINECFKNNKNLKIFNEENDTYNDIKNLALKSEARFITILNNCSMINNPNFFEIIYNKTIGKIDNIFEYKIEKEINYLIRSKILKDIFDNELIFEDFFNLEKYIKLTPTLNVNYISISFSVDKNYLFFCYVSMISILESKNFNTYILFYLLVPKNFSDENKTIILSLYDQYDFLNITFIFMDERYKNVKSINYLNHLAYYRLSLGELLPNLNKIIYLDCDVIVYRDLTNLFNTNFNGYLILSRKMPNENVNSIFKINSGVLLLNLKKMRAIKFEEKVLNIIKNGFISIVQDQGLLIKYYLNQIGYLNEKYNLVSQGFNNLIKYYKNNNLNYKNNDLLYILKYPTIRHFNGPKKSNNYIDSEDWWYFASKAKYYFLILKAKNKR